METGEMTMCCFGQAGRLAVLLGAVGLGCVNNLPAQDESKVNGARVFGTVLLPDDKPAIGANVYLIKRGEGAISLPMKPDVTISDDSGKFAFNEAQPGNYRIWAETPDLTSLDLKFKGEEVVVAEDAKEQMVDLLLHLGCRYRVKVSEKASGNPVSKATISFGWTDIQRSYSTNEAGECEIAGLASGEWYFVVTAEGLATTYRNVPKQPLHSMTELAFQLAPGCDVEGRVVNEKGEPVAGVRIRANEISASMTPGYGKVDTDDDGRFVLKSLPSGDVVRLSADKKDHDRLSQEITLPLDQKTFKVDLTLPTTPYGGDCIVTVVDENGKLVADAVVENEGNSTADVRRGITGVDGKVKLENVFSSFRGTTAIVDAKGFIKQRVELIPGPIEQPGEITVALVPGETIHGRLLKPDGQPASGVRVYYNHGERAFELGGRVDTDQEGCFFAEGLPNPCTFTFYTPAPYAPIRDRNLPVGTDEEVVVQMEMEGVIRVRAIDAATKKPIAAFNVKVGFPSNRNRGAGSLSSSLMNPGTDVLGAKKEFRLGQLTLASCLNCTVSAKGYVRSIVENVEAVLEEGSVPLDVELTPEDNAMFLTVAGKLQDAAAKPVHAALVRLMVLDPKFPQDISQNWRLIETERIATESCCLQFLKTATAADGSFRFDRVQADGLIVLTVSGRGIANKFYPLLVNDQTSDLANLKLQTTSCGKLQVNVDLDAYPEAHTIQVQPKTADILLRHVSRQIPAKQEPAKHAEMTFEDLPPGSYDILLQSKPEEIGRGGFTQKVIATMTADIVANQEAKVKFE